jgi:hypothetical protein
MNSMSFSGFKTVTAEISQLVTLNLKDIINTSTYLDVIEFIVGKESVT